MIPIFSSINELHHAAQSGLSTRLSNFHIIRNEAASDQMVKQMPSHRCDFHQICLDHRSDYHLGLDEKTHQITNHNLYFIPRGTIINWQSEHDNHWKGYTIFVKAEFMSFNHRDAKNNFFISGQPSVLPLNEEALQQLSSFCEQMLAEQASALKDFRVVLRDWFSLFLQYCNRYFNVQECEDYSYEMQIKYKFQELLNFHIEKQRNVDFYANALHLSPKHFTRLIKKATGRTPKRVIVEKLTEVAKERLKNSNLPIAEIAYGLGFNHTPQFNKHFKEVTGTTPSEYRRLLQQSAH